MAETYTLTGILRSIKKTSGSGNKGDWTRAALELDLGEGKKATISTFEDASIKLSEALQGKEVTVKFTKSQKGTTEYKNLIENGLSAGGFDVGAEEEVIGEQAVPQRTLKQPASPDVIPAPKRDDSVQRFMDKEDYWRNKENRDIANEAKREAKDKQIARHGALNTSVEILSLKVKNGGKLDAEVPVLEQAKSLACLILSFVEGKEEQPKS